MSLPTEQHFKCDCVYPCEHYPHCGGHKITFSNLEHFILKEDGKNGLKNPLELRDMTRDDLINYIDRLHNDLLSYQLVFDQVARADKHITRNKI